MVVRVFAVRAYYEYVVVVFILIVFVLFFCECFIGDVVLC